MMQTSFLIEREIPARHKVRELPPEDWPVNRLSHMGAGALSTVELLAAILQTPEALSQAEELLAKFDGLRGIAQVSQAELTQIDGIGPNLAARIKAAVELGRRTLTCNSSERPPIRNPDEIYALCTEMCYLDQEELWVLNLNSKNRLIQITKLYRGSLNTQIVRVGEIFADAIKLKAASIVVVHNHPSGDPTPSPEDLHMSQLVRDAGKLLDIELLDSVVIGLQRYISLHQRELI